jgi:hypothetical protein
VGGPFKPDFGLSGLFECPPPIPFARDELKSSPNGPHANASEQREGSVHPSNSPTPCLCPFVFYSPRIGLLGWPKAGELVQVRALSGLFSRYDSQNFFVLHNILRDATKAIVHREAEAPYYPVNPIGRDTLKW